MKKNNLLFLNEIVLVNKFNKVSLINSLHLILCIASGRKPRPNEKLVITRVI